MSRRHIFHKARFPREERGLIYRRAAGNRALHVYLSFKRHDLSLTKSDHSFVFSSLNSDSAGHRQNIHSLAGQLKSPLHRGLLQLNLSKQKIGGYSTINPVWNLPEIIFSKRLLICRKRTIVCSSQLQVVTINTTKKNPLNYKKTIQYTSALLMIMNSVLYKRK